MIFPTHFIFLYMEGLLVTTDYNSLEKSDNIRVVYDKTTDLVWIDTPSIQSLYEFIDLGLPSGTKWASCNVGATKPEEFSLYFAWGETEGYSGITNTKKFTELDYKYCNGSISALTKYNYNSTFGRVDNLTTLELVDDAAYVSDKTCRMPTKADFQELTANTTNTLVTLNGVNGRKFTSKTNGNSIFVPSAGQCYNGSVSLVGTIGCLWSGSLHDNGPGGSWLFIFYPNSVGIYSNLRYYGCPVRAVL